MKPLRILSRFRPLTGLLLILPLRAQSPEPPGFPLARALQRTAAEHPALLAARHGERAAGELVAQAGQAPVPALEVTVENVLGTGARRGVRELEATVQASQTWERGGKRGQRVALARRERDVAAGDVAVREAELLAATAFAYVEAVAARARRELAEEPWQLARRTLAAVEERVRAGAGSPAETARARAALAAAEGERARADAAVASTRAALASAWGGGEEPGAPAGRIRLPETLPAPAELAAWIERHPEALRQEQIVASERAALSLERDG